MLTHEELREELIRQLDGGSLVAAAVARDLGIAPARVTEMKKRERRVQQDEMPKLARLLGLEGSGPNARPISSTAKIMNMGKVAQGVWLEESLFRPDDDEAEFVEYDRMAGDPASTDLFAVTPEGTSMNLAFMPGTQLICRRVVFGSAELSIGDYVIVERASHDLREYTCKRLGFDNGEFTLHSESTDDRYKEPWCIGLPSEDHHDDSEVRVIAKVVRSVKNH